MSETIETVETNSPIVRPVTNKKCVFQLLLTAQPASCSRKATMSLDGKALCDQHAEFAMTAACGRNVRIKR